MKWKTIHEIESEERKNQLLHCVSKLLHAGMIGSVESRVLRNRIRTHQHGEKLAERTTDGVLDK